MTLKQVTARSAINKYSLLAGAAGLIPAPGLDMLGIGGVQYAMIRKLAEQYNVPMPAKEQVMAIVAALTGSLGATKVAYGAGGSLLKSVPLVGTTLGMVSVSVFASALTYAIGKVFMMHFETGGNFLTLNPDKLRGHFEAEFRAGAAQAA
ncbi:MAG: DUF697 domain-containing protein [Betaproteobacteria bacterium]|nr:DUF697 domain-containing protein [Betaproteobacteria bacterium]